MTTHYILAIDAGTTGIQASLFDNAHFTMYGNNKIAFTQFFPQSGFVEHDPNEIWKTTCQAIENACQKAEVEIKNFSRNKICAIGISNQRETCLGWNLKTFDSPFHAIVWQDRRTAAFCEAIKKNPKLRKKIQKITGLVCDPYFSATKMRWLLQNNETIKTWSQENVLALGTIDSFLVWKLTNHTNFVTDHTNASRTMLYNLDTGDYDDELLNFFQVPRRTLPRILPSIGSLASTDRKKSGFGGFGQTKNLSCLPDGIPILSVLGDQQAALYGQNCLKKGNTKITFGTGAFILMNTGQKRVFSPHGLLTTVACSTGKKRTFALEGSAFVAGAAVQFVRDNFGWIHDSAASEALALAEPRDPDVLFVPALSGLGSPYWNPHAKGALLGLTRGTTKSHMMRAVLESMAFQNVLLMNMIQKDSGVKLSKLAVDGGGSANRFLMQFQADVMQTKLVRPSNIETTSLGVALAAFEAFSGKHATYNPQETAFTVKIDSKEAKAMTKKWLHAVESINQFY